MPAAGAVKKTTKNKKRICRCGCQQSVSDQTERNHCNGKARPLVKAHHAARRLAVLGLSPGSARGRLLKSPIFSPSPRQRARQGKRRDVPPAMDVDDDDAAPPQEDMLPIFGAHDIPGDDAGPSNIRPVTPEPAPLGGPSRLYDPETVPDLHAASTAARKGVWSNRHPVTIEEEPEDDPDAAMYMDADLDDEEEFWGPAEEEYDEYEWEYGLPAGDIMDEEWERELAEFGMHTVIFP